MTKNAARKRAARQIQEESGMPYTAALKYTDAYLGPQRFSRLMWSYALPEPKTLRSLEHAGVTVHTVGYLTEMGALAEDFLLPGAVERIPFPVGPHARIIPWRDERHPKGHLRSFRLVWSDHPLPEDLTVIDPWF